MILDNKELELAAVGISIAAGCLPCTRYHIAEADKFGARESEILECLHSAIVVANKSLSDLQQQFDPEAVPSVNKQESAPTIVSRISALTGVGAAVARNSVKRLKLSIRAAHEVGIKDDEIMEIAGLAKRIKVKAESHLEPMINKLDADPEIASTVASLCT